MGRNNIFSIPRRPPLHLDTFHVRLAIPQLALIQFTKGADPAVFQRPAPSTQPPPVPPGVHRNIPAAESTRSAVVQFLLLSATTVDYIKPAAKLVRHVDHLGLRQRWLAEQWCDRDWVLGF
jgi:hypothetical protein